MSRINFGIRDKALLTVIPALALLYLTRHRIPFRPDTGQHTTHHRANNVTLE